MKELSIEEKAKAYDKALEKARQLCAYPTTKPFISDLQDLFPELKESEDEEIRKGIIAILNNYVDNSNIFKAKILALLEKQGEQKPYMIQWKGNNLKEVIDFTGKDKNFGKWFKSFEEYEKYVDDHNGIFKLFNADGSHYEIPVGAWIVKTPDGYNVASKAKYKQKSAECNNSILKDKLLELFQRFRWYCKDETPTNGDIIDYVDAHIQELIDTIQKPAEWSEEDIIHLNNCISYMSRLNASEMDWLKSLKDKVQPQPKQEWRQENTGDLTDFENAMMHIGGSFFGENAGLDPNDTNAIKEQANILLGLVPKQEWSKEDEEHIESILKRLDGMCKKGATFTRTRFAVNQDMDWLKSLRPQNTWKPSAFHLGCITDAISMYKDRGINAIGLKEILDELKKLREE